MTPTSEKILLKDRLFNKEKVQSLAKLVKGVYPDFKSTQFQRETLKKFPELELMERYIWIQEKLQSHLPDDYREALAILLASVEDLPDENKFIFSSYTHYVSVMGCSKKHLPASLKALEAFTRHCSAEFAIRPFINKFPELTFKKILQWSKHKNPHVRRLASEGMRPKLPWAKAITIDYKLALLVLNNLYHDNERYVTRSVANHLNDISKINPSLVLKQLGKWKKEGKQNDAEMQYIINHSLRTLIKRGDKNTLKFLGYKPNPKVEISNLKLKKKTISIGESIEFSFDALAEKNENLVIDYKVTYATPHKRVSQKVFKLKTLKAQSGAPVTLSKRHAFRLMTTKKLYSGMHTLEIQVNGNVLAATDFIIRV